MKNKNVFHIDDDPNWFYVLPELGELIGIEINSAQNYEDHLKMIDQKEIDLFITDIRLPDKSGYDLIIEHRKKRPDLPIIVTTAYDTEKVHEFVKENNVNAILIKPFSVVELRKILETLLEN